MPRRAEGDGLQKQASEPHITDSTDSSYPNSPPQSSPVEKSQQIIPKSPKPKDTSVTRWSFCEAALAHAREHGELPLCPMCAQWTPWCLRHQIEVQKGYKLKTGERWITIHPSGKDGGCPKHC